MANIVADRVVNITWPAAWMSQFELFGIDFLGLGRSGNNPWWIPAPVLAEANSDQGSTTLTFPAASAPEDGFWMCLISAGPNATKMKGTQVTAEVIHPYRSIFTIPASETHRDLSMEHWAVSTPTTPMPTFGSTAYKQSNACRQLANFADDDFESSYLEAADIFCASAVSDRDTPLVSFDPATILLILQALQVIVPWIRDYCEVTSRDAIAHAPDINIIQRWRLSAMLRSQLGTKSWNRMGRLRSVNHLQAIAASENADAIMSTMWAGQPANGLLYARASK